VPPAAKENDVSGGQTFWKKFGSKTFDMAKAELSQGEI
jgi:hypothetical protein